MPQLSLASWILVVVVGLFTAIAAIWDYRQHRIPNNLTLPVFFAGWVYQAVFHGWPGIGNAAGGFLVGFGVLFLLWMVGGGGGGDVKLMAALGTWLGWLMVLKVLFVSLIFVTTGTMGIVAFGLLSKGLRRTKEQYMSKSNKGKGETTDQRKKRRVMAFALPVALATWCVLALQFFGTTG